MITVAQIVDKIIKRSPFLEEALSQNLINLSALARLIKEEVENETLKPVKEEAVLMALRRRPMNLRSKLQIARVFKKNHDLIIRSGLIEYSVQKAKFPIEKYEKILEQVRKQEKYFLTVTQGVFETTIIISQELEEGIKKIINPENIISFFDNLSSITVCLPEKIVLTPGVYYSILKLLAWEGINVVEVVSTFTEFTIILQDPEVDRAFSVLKAGLS